MAARICIKELVAMWNAGVPTAEISKLLNCHPETVRRRAAAAGLQKRQHGGTRKGALR